MDNIISQTYEIEVEQFEDTDEPKPTEEDIRMALIEGLRNRGFDDISAVNVTDKN